MSGKSVLQAIAVRSRDKRGGISGRYRLYLGIRFVSMTTDVNSVRVRVQRDATVEITKIQFEEGRK